MQVQEMVNECGPTVRVVACLRVCGGGEVYLTRVGSAHRLTALPNSKRPPPFAVAWRRKKLRLRAGPGAPMTSDRLILRRQPLLRRAEDHPPRIDLLDRGRRDVVSRRRPFPFPNPQSPIAPPDEEQDARRGEHEGEDGADDGADDESRGGVFGLGGGIESGCRGGSAGEGEGVRAGAEDGVGAGAGNWEGVGGEGSRRY